MHCTNWPSSFDYECQNEEGDDWTLLSDSINTTDECELLCLQNASDVGCCSVSPGDECYWKGGATVAKAIGDNSSLAVACTYTEPGILCYILSTNIKINPNITFTSVFDLIISIHDNLSISRFMANRGG